MTVLDPSMDMGDPAPALTRAKGRELKMLGHDIRDALQGVLGGLRELETAALPPELREQVERAAAAAQTLAYLLGAALGDEPEPAPPEGRVDIEQFLGHLRRRYGGEARARGLRFQAAAEDGLPRMLRLDPVSLARVICNVVGHALEHAGRGTVRLVAAPTQGGIRFRVTSEGPVPSPAFRGGSRLGSDLALAAAKSLTDRLGGELVVGNNDGVDVVVGFTAAAAVAPDAASGAGGRIDLGGLRVLLAEDNPTNQMVATQMLKALNAEVMVCADGIEALERFERDAVDLVVVDIEMPRLSGLDVIRAIRGRADARARVPIVALTAYAMREHRDRIADAGADGLISKPITSVEALGRALAAHAPRPAAAPAAPEAGSGPVVDAATFEALAQAIGADMMAELLDKVVADLLGTRRDLAGSIAPVDREPIRSASHILISVAGAIGATRLHACARALNAAAHAGRLEGIEAEVGRCIAEIDAAVAFARDRRGAS